MFKCFAGLQLFWTQLEVGKKRQYLCGVAALISDFRRFCCDSGMEALEGNLKRKIKIVALTAIPLICISSIQISEAEMQVVWSV